MITFRPWHVPDEWQQRYALLGGSPRKGFIASLGGCEKLLVLVWKERDSLYRVGATILRGTTERRRPTDEEMQYVAEAASDVDSHEVTDHLLGSHVRLLVGALHSQTSKSASTAATGA